MKRDKGLIVRLSEDEHKLVKIEATKRGISISDFVRKAINELLKKD